MNTTHESKQRAGMPWSWRIATVAGIPIYLHGTFLLLIVIVLGRDWVRQQSAAAAGAGVLFLLAVFGTVVLHELGHALMARRYSIRTRDITLLPIGGLARLERMPDVPSQELWVALAGPAVNLALAAITYIVMVTAQSTPPASWLSLPPDVMGRFLEINIWLAAFNMIPAFPMDGGRVLRALLAQRFDYVRATRTAASIGQGLAFAFALIGFFYNPVLLFIAFFVWMGASSEAMATETRSTLAGVPLTAAMITDFKALGASEPLARAVGLVLAGSQRDFPVLEGDRIAGILTRDALVAALAQAGPSIPVGEVMDRRFETADASEMLEPVLERFETCRCQVLPVVRAGRLVGILTPDNVAEFVMFGRAARLRAAAAAATA